MGSLSVASGMSASATPTLPKPPICYTGVVPEGGLPAEGRTMLAATLALIAIAYGLAVIYFEEVTG